MRARDFIPADELLALTEGKPLSAEQVRARQERIRKAQAHLQSVVATNAIRLRAARERLTSVSG
jgi:hypothetical protein